MMPITGQGSGKGNYSKIPNLKKKSLNSNNFFIGNIDATIVMQGQRIKKDNETYFNVQDFFVDFDIGHAYIQLDNLFNGDKELG